MATINYVERADAPENVGKVYDQMAQAMGGRVPAIARAMAHNHGIFDAFVRLNAASNHTQLDARLRELAYLAVSRLNGCDYCAYYHTFAGRQAGLTDRQLAEVLDFETSDAYSAREKDVMRYAAQVARDLAPDPALVARLKETLSDRELMELTFTAGLASLTNRFNLALGNDLP
jgi:uncharacterized peroxidase-related enzyme